MICVDPLSKRGIGGMFRLSCHLFSDDFDLEALHKFAARIGLKRVWFQYGRFPHYDLTKSKRCLAIQYGAQSVDRRHFVDANRSDVEV